MFENYYPTIKKLIDEYITDKVTLSPNREIFIYYPQLFVIASMSLFEKDIKERCNNIITNPAVSFSSLPRLRNLINSHPHDILRTIYGKLLAQEIGGIPNLSANDFYALYGSTFKRQVEVNFDTLKNSETNNYLNIVKNLYTLIGVDDKYNNAYIENEDIYNRLNVNNFNNAETAFLKLKLYRNKVAHNFLNGISDSFEDIRNIYYDAVLYVVALIQELKGLSTI